MQDVVKNGAYDESKHSSKMCPSAKHHNGRCPWSHDIADLQGYLSIASAAVMSSPSSDVAHSTDEPDSDTDSTVFSSPLS